MEQKHLTDKEFLEIIIDELLKKSREELFDNYNACKNKHEKIDFIISIAESIEYDYDSYMEIIRRNFFPPLRKETISQYFINDTRWQN